MCPGSVNRDTAVFQSVEKDEATQAIICTILSASNTSLWRLLLKGFYGEVYGGGGERLEKKKLKKREKSGLEKMGRDSSVWCSTLFSWRIMGLLQRGAVPPMTVCLPVRMGTVSACDWMPVLALWSGWSLHCGTASE